MLGSVRPLCQQRSDPAAVLLAPELISFRNLVCLYFMNFIQDLESSIVPVLFVGRTKAWCLPRELYCNVRFFC